MTARESPGANPGHSPAQQTADQAIKGHGNTLAGSLNYADAGQVARYVIDAALHASDQNGRPLSALDLRVVLAALHRTVTFSKDADRLGTRQLARIVYGIDDEALQGWQRRNVTASLRHLKDLGLIEYEPGSGRSARTYICFPQGALSESPSDEKGDEAQHETESGVAPNVIGIAATPSNPAEESAVSENEKIVDRVVALIRCSTMPWERERADTLDVERLRRLIEKYDAPDNVYAGAILDQPNSLRQFPRRIAS